MWPFSRCLATVTWVLRELGGRSEAAPSMGDHRRSSLDPPAGRSQPGSLSQDVLPGRSQPGSLSQDVLPDRSQPGSLSQDILPGRSQPGSLSQEAQPRAQGSLEEEEDLSVPGTAFEQRDSKYQDVEDGGRGSLVQEAELPPEEEVAVEEPLNPEEATSEQQQALKKDTEEGVAEMSRLSITQRFPGRRHRLRDLARPKTDWQSVKDRSTRRRRRQRVPRIKFTCQGYTWVSPCMKSLHFCIYWPSVYWTERFVKDTTLSITVPAVSRRVEELARPKRFYSEYYNNNRRAAGWPVQRPTLKHQASSRLQELATPKPRNNIWCLAMSQVSQVSKAAQTAVPSKRTLRLSQPRAPAALAEEWDPMPKPKHRMSDYNRLLQLSTPKAQSEKCVPDRDPRWEVQDVTKKAVASPRTLSLAQPKVRKDLNEGYDPYHISPATLLARASPRLDELATPKSTTRKA
ncbi:sperm microtubule associated protein 2 isoform X1 [Erinaceus europaeus]|uniref:Sperm microtubule associated protein 2 isoform X1 n=1 Tax=Erinaceus europaeus TaxID=9365 RepID=A0ABM3WLC4_ERIEU|nr:sperm microtubule associated protein 2 isoform X1 [Erinaceus europaeus]